MSGYKPGDIFKADDGSGYLIFFSDSDGNVKELLLSREGRGYISKAVELDEYWTKIIPESVEKTNSKNPIGSVWAQNNYVWIKTGRGIKAVSIKYGDITDGISEESLDKNKASRLV